MCCDVRFSMCIQTGLHFPLKRTIFSKQDVDSEECVFEEIVVRDFYSVFKSYPYSNERWMVGVSKDGHFHCITCLRPLEKYRELHSLTQVVAPSLKNL